MASSAVVVGGGVCGRRAAAFLARAGRSVVQVVGPSERRVDEGVLVGRGVSSLPAGFHDEACLAVGSLETGVALDGVVETLPLSRGALAEAFPITALADAAIAYGRARGTTELKKLIGGGNETRTYRDWIASRFGEPAYRHLYAPYAAKRFGDPAVVSCNVARLFHGVVDGPLHVVPPSAFDGHPAVTVVQAHVRSITAGRVQTDAGEIEGDVFVDIAPAHVVRWLPEDAAAALRADVAELGAVDGVEVSLLAGAALPFEVHAVDSALPFFRLTQPGVLPGWERLGGSVVAHFVVRDDATDAEWVARATAGLARLGVRSDAASARVTRLAAWHPVWRGPHLSRMRRYLLTLAELGVTPVGRAGLHAPVSWGQEQAWLRGVIEGTPVRELARRVVEPPVLDPAERLPMARFVER